MSSLLAGSSLIEPLDLVRFCATYVFLAVVPGYALATLARPRSPRSERLALAIPCAYSLVALVGLLTVLTHIPFGLPIYELVALPVTLAGVRVLWKRRGKAPANTKEYWWLIPTSVAVLQSAIVIALYAGYVVPVGYDAVIHVAFTNLVAHSHLYPITLISSHIGANDGPFYPPAFHALSALVLSIAPMATYRAVFLSVVAATSLFSVGLFTYVRVATGSARLGGLAALSSLAFEPLPLFGLAEGLYPVIIALIFVPALAVALRHGLGRGDRRAVALAAVLGVGLFYTHPTEFVVVGLAAISIVPAVLRDRRAWMRAFAYGSLIVLAWGLAALPARAALHRAVAYVPSGTTNASGSNPLPKHPHLTSLALDYVQWIYGRNMSYLLLVAVIIGVAWCLIHRRQIGFVVVQAVMVSVFLDVSSYNLIQHLHVLSFHWTLLERLAPAHYWFALPLAAIGIDVVARRIERLFRTKSLRLVALMATPLIVYGVVLPLGITIAGLSTYSNTRKVLAPADLGSLTWLSHHAPSDSVVLNDGDMTHPAIIDGAVDAGLWLPALNGPQPVFFRSTDGQGPIVTRVYVLRHIADKSLMPPVSRFIARYHVRYVFYGAQIASMASRHLRLNQLLADSHMHLVYTSVPDCSAHSAAMQRVCPPTGSYVFALNSLIGSDMRGGPSPSPIGLLVGRQPRFNHASTTLLHCACWRRRRAVQTRIYWACGLDGE